jgi:Tol biopolymer transport system component
VPDGTAIVFGLQVKGQTDIYRVAADGSELTQLTDTPDADEWWPDWSVG